MDTTDLSDFKSLFIDTARKHIETMQVSLIGLQKTPTNIVLMNNIYIAAHSLKGESLAMGYMTNAAVSQLIEKIFHAAKDAAFVLTSEILETVLQSAGELSRSIDCIEKEDKECVLNDQRMTLEKVSGVSLD